MATFKSKYLGDLRTTATHLGSDDKLITDAPIDNQGKGQTFSPTDLVATALGCCMATVMGIHGRREGIDLSGLHWETVKEMNPHPRKISAIKIRFKWPHPHGSAEQLEKLKEIARSCPVALSLHPDVMQEVTFDF